MISDDAEVETLVIGGGTAGCAIAGLMAERTSGEILLVEAGPDYGPRGPAWPSELLDASQLPLTHEWGYRGSRTQNRVAAFSRARVVGGCSSHNGCQMVLGHRLDYDGWAALGNAGWSTDDLLPSIERALRRLRITRPRVDQLTPYGAASLEAFIATGLPLVDDLNDLDGTHGAGPNPVNIVGGVRWNAAFAYLDPVRDQANVSISAETRCEALVFDGLRVVGARIRLPDGSARIVRAGRVILSAGTYESPAILLRSGIGDPDLLERVGIKPRHPLPGVGRNLQDHPAVPLRFAGTPELRSASRAFAMHSFHPEEQLVAKVTSSRRDPAFDLHFYTQGGERRDDPGEWIWEYMVAVLPSRSRGRVVIGSADALAPPQIDHAFLSDRADWDLDVLTEGFELLRASTREPRLARLLGPETLPGDEFRTRSDIRDAVRDLVGTAFHAVGTCKMGPAHDAEAVVDERLNVRGLDGVYVADASVMPTIPRANTMLPTVILAERFVERLLGGRQGHTNCHPSERHHATLSVEGGQAA